MFVLSFFSTMHFYLRKVPFLLCYYDLFPSFEFEVKVSNLDWGSPIGDDTHTYIHVYIRYKFELVTLLNNFILS